MLRNSQSRLIRERVYLGKAAMDFGDLVVRQVGPVYEKLGLSFPVAASSTIHAIGLHGPIPQAEIARQLGYSHQLVGQKLKALTDKALIDARNSPEDARIKLYELTREGRRQFEIYSRFRESAADVFGELYDEIGIDLAAAFERASQALDARPLEQRFASRKEE